MAIRALPKTADARLDSMGRPLYSNNRSPGSGPPMYMRQGDRMSPVADRAPPEETRTAVGYGTIRTCWTSSQLRPTAISGKQALMGKPHTPLPSRSYTPKSPPSPPAPQLPQEELTRMVRARWTPEKLEQLIKDKVEAKTNGYPAFSAMRLFNTGRGSPEITFAQFKGTIERLLNVEMTHDEAFGLFAKYDLDGGGTIDPQEFLIALMPPPTTYGQNRPMPSDRKTMAKF